MFGFLKKAVKPLRKIIDLGGAVADVLPLPTRVKRFLKLVDKIEDTISEEEKDAGK